MLDVIVAGAGPAGSIAALVLARAGARVLIVDREAFPRDKLCGDTLNPGALALLASLGLSGGPLTCARPLDGMLVTGPRASVQGMYGMGTVGRSMTRRDLDLWLLEQAIHAGAKFESRVVARQPLLADANGDQCVRGLALAARGDHTHVVRTSATMVIAADGTRSSLARALGLATYPRQPRRWAFGVYATGIAQRSEVGEMHIRPGAYLGIAPLTDTLANVCVVTDARPEGRAPLDVIRRVIDRDAALASRFTSAEFVGAVRVLGPLAVDVRVPGVKGLLLAGDAAGFVDPMTGDGLHLAMRGALLAAEAALGAIDTGDFDGAVQRLAVARRKTLGAKLRFNRALRWIAGSPAAMGMGSVGAVIAPGFVRRMVRYAGDVDARRP